jgi:hypothetical protein
VFLLLALYWNTSIAREVTLDHAVPTDSLAAPNLAIDRQGRLRNTTGDLLLDRMVTAASFWNASVVAHETGLTLWHAHGTPRLRSLIVGLYADDWLNESARIRAWPASPHQGTALAFTLSLPRDWTETARMQLGKSTFAIAPGSRHQIVCWNAAGPVDVISTTRDALFDQANRTLAVQLSKPDVLPVPAGRTGTGCADAGA